MKINSNLKLREIAGEKMVIMSGDAGVDLTKVVTLNKSAELLWNSLRGKEFSKADVVGLLQHEYGISIEDANKDAAEWIDSMIKEGLIEP